MSHHHSLTFNKILAAAFVVGSVVLWCRPLWAAPAKLLRTSAYEAPVSGEPGDLLLIAGSGLDATDRVVYAAAQGTEGSKTHPAGIPDRSDADVGTASVVRQAGLPYSLAVQLPKVMQSGRQYRLWVVNAAQEWSEPVSINDPRPLWITPSYVYCAVDFAGLGRRVRVIGRNLAPVGSTRVRLRLRGPATYVLEAGTAEGRAAVIEKYVVDAELPAHIIAGTYAVSVNRDGSHWVDLPNQQLVVRRDPLPIRNFSLSDPGFGACRPDDGVDDSACLQRAVKAASDAGGGVVVVPPGTWDVSSLGLPPGEQRDGFVLQPGVSLKGSGADGSTLVRHDALSAPPQGALLTLTGGNTVSGLTFRDADRFDSPDRSRPIIQLGASYRSHPDSQHPLDPVVDVIVAENVFRPVGRAIQASGRPIARLFITHNEFGAYDNGLLLVGDTGNIGQAYRIDDSVVRWNHFEPGSYLDLRIRQGTIASQFGASFRVDFSSNVADGANVAALQAADDAPGWRAAFFWNMNNNHEFLLVAANRITCSGDKAGDGEALGFDGNGDTWAFDHAQRVTAAGSDWVAVGDPLRSQQQGQAVDTATYYKEHWIQVMEGPGLGQTRRIAAYGARPEGSGGVYFRVSPKWDVVPVAGTTRIAVGRQYWQLYVIANDIDQRTPLCKKANLSAPSGGLISLWAQAADTTIEGNRQWDTDGITFQQAYEAKAASCPSCGGSTTFSTALEIRGNVIDGEYDWSSDCSRSGILGSFGASPTPESKPPIVGFGPVIAYNVITHADALFGGAIDIASTWYRGPPPGDWPLVESPLIFRNVIRDVSGPPPRPACRYGQGARVGIRLGSENVRNAVLSGNACERVDTFLADSGKGTERVCSASGETDCECGKQ